MIDEYKPKEIEEKWVSRWDEKDIFEVDPSNEDSFYVNVAYPYPSGSMHVGHGRTYTLPDIVARYKRMQGFNVLFPMAWHVTGTPVIGISRRIRERDEDTLDLYKNLYKVPEEKISDFENPLEIVKYFSNEYKEIMRRMGYSIDWRRQFKTVDDEYKSFITWQFRRLKEKNVIGKGTHPVKYCPNDENPLGDHDLLEGEEAEINEFYLIKFETEDGFVLPCATLRPETVFGVTNIWIKPTGDYVKINLDEKEKWIVSKKAVNKLKEQNHVVDVIEDVKGRELIGKSAQHPKTGEVPVSQGDFVDLDVASGVVMSVPAHAPYDLAATKDLETEIEPKKIIEVSGYDGIPAKRILEKYGISDQNNEDLDEATEELYGDEFSKGEMVQEIDKYGGMNVRKARDQVGKDLVNEGLAEKMYEFSEKPVVCRCGEEAIVKVLENQWFIDYKNQEWKRKTHDAIDEMDLVPDEIDSDFHHTIDWLKEWACTRKVGLGTNLPWDKDWIIEPLSDSTLYMAFYTISKYLKKEDNELTDEFFDYIFLDKGDKKEVSEKTGIAPRKIEEMKKEFEYWYPYDYRFSAKDLISNHLTFQMFHHTAIFPQNKWPQGVSVLGMGLLEGEKMSSSKGNVILLEDAIEEYGADTVRFFLASNAEPWQDFDWRENQVKSTKNNLKNLWKMLKRYLEMEGKKDLKKIDKWLLSKFNRSIKNTVEKLENHETRSAVQHSFYLFKKKLNWYKKRTNLERKGAKWTLNTISQKWIKLLSPFIPFLTEEIWSKQEKDTLLIEEDYPEPDEEYINERIEAEENLIKKVRNDINEIIEVTEKDPEEIYIYTASDWKKDILNKVSKSEKMKIGELMSDLMKEDKYRKRGDKVKDTLQDIINEIQGINKKEIKEIIEINEKKTLSRAKNFLKNEFNAKIHINEEGEGYDPKNKGKTAIPYKPALYLN
ncbi:MAG: Leucyl-tRNA synthetase [Candidatus Methanohalarchaeum thermophilum]|uniref:Leucine--tRNA ligase n=1 Tax=Methanohalarchaeum thermophilum TaxID=1903181 RepID=A0A1Q6DTH5_METT1|nr:MAG: Leucyl-tRNA synthetase [Candidatus Methanohalarchaeum thermophilum]